jgi:ATP-dependent Lon protease
LTGLRIITDARYTLQKYLIPQAQLMSGIGADRLTINDGALNTLIKQYCRESGVRNLQKKIEKVCTIIPVMCHFSNVTADLSQGGIKIDGTIINDEYCC